MPPLPYGFVAVFFFSVIVDTVFGVTIVGVVEVLNVLITAFWKYEWVNEGIIVVDGCMFRYNSSRWMRVFGINDPD